MPRTASISTRSAADRVEVTQRAVFGRIVACIDSASELPALEGAARVLARRRHSQVLVIHVAKNPLTAEIFPELAVRRDIESTGEAQALIDEAVRGLRRSGMSASGIVLAEPAARTSDQIVRAAAEFRPDLLLIGSRGLTSVHGLLAGSVSHQVLTKTPCPVLCLPGGVPKLRLRRILVAWDGTPGARAALSLAHLMSRVYAASVAAIHVGHGIARPERSASRANASFAEVDEGPEGVADTLNETAHRLGADVIVMGSHGRGDVAAMILGSVVHRLLAISERPVLVVRPRKGPTRAGTGRSK